MENFNNKVADGLETVALYEGVYALSINDVKAGEMIPLDDEDVCEMSVGAKQYDKHIALFTFCKMLRDGVVDIKCNDLDNMDWKYFVELLDKDCDE